MADAEGQGYKLQGSRNLSTIPPTHADYIGMLLTVDNGNDGICVFVACLFSVGRATAGKTAMGWVPTGDRRVGNGLARISPDYRPTPD